MPESTIKFQDELFIRDGQVFNREIFESPVGDIEKLLEDACLPQTHKVLPLQFPSVLRNEWCMGHWFGVTPKNETIVFTEIQYVPFPDAHAVKTSGGHYILNFSRNRNIPADEWVVQEGQEQPTRIRMGNCPKWYPPAHCRFFIMYQPHERQSTYEPMLFMVHNNEVEPIIPKIPNVFNTGNICAGDAFNESCNAETDVFGKIKAALDTIRIAPANSDLRENDQLFIQWKLNEDNHPIQQLIPWVSGFGRNATDSRILEFTKMIRKS